MEKSNFQWSGFDWNCGDKGWNIIHPDKAYCWHDKSCVNIEDNAVYLHAKKNEKYFDLWSKEKGIYYTGSSPIGVGWIETVKEKPFTYGYFEVTCYLPKGDHMWPAIWLTGIHTWPPEIDLIEGYSNGNRSYWNWIPFWDVQSNVHFKNGLNGKNSIGGKAHRIGCKNPIYEPRTYACDWQEDYIRIYYDGRLVREVTEDTMVRKRNSSGKKMKEKEYVLQTFIGAKMKLIINNHIQASTKTHEFIEQEPMLIESLTYRKTK